jgi:hypothetical protein
MSDLACAERRIVCRWVDVMTPEEAAATPKEILKRPGVTCAQCVVDYDISVCRATRL